MPNGFWSTVALRPVQALGRWIRNFLVDPLTVKELSGIARRWQTYAGRGVYVGVIGGIVALFWNAVVRAGTLRSPSAYAELGRQIFFSFFSLQMVVVTMGGISAGSDMITRELRGGTLGLLALTPLTSWRIAAGKWKAAFLVAAGSLLCGAPAFAISLFLGGVGPWQLLYAVTLSIAVGALGAAIGLYASTVFQRGYVAHLVSLVLVLVYCVAPLLLFVMVGDGRGMMSVLSCVHPLYAAFGAAGVVGGLISWESLGWIPASAIVGVEVFVLLHASSARIRGLVRRPGSLDAPASGASAILPRAGRAPRTAAFARLLRGGGQVWERNAILWKELSTRRAGAGCAPRLGLLLLTLALFSVLFDTQGFWRVVVYWFSWFVFLLVALGSGVSLFVTEREERKWEILLSTPLGAVQIVGAKLCAGLVGMAPLCAVLLGFWCASEHAAGIRPAGLLMNLGALCLAGLLVYVVGAAVSLHARSQRAAFSTSFGLAMGFLFVLPIVLLILQGNRILFTKFEMVDFVIGSTNPATYMAHVSNTLGDRYGGHDVSSQISRQEELWPMFQVYLGVYSTLAAALVGFMIRRFDRAAGRA